MRGLAFAVLVVGFAGCAEKPKIEDCWSPEAKQTVALMVRSRIVDIVGKQITALGRQFDYSAQKLLESHLKLTIDDYAGAGINQAGLPSCSASVLLESQWPGSPPVTSRMSALSFGVFQGEKGKVYQLLNPAQVDELVAMAK